MTFYNLPNYLRTHRRRAGLSQKEVAYLLGCKNGSKISRYEHFSQTPSLKTAFSYEVLFRTSAKELFSGIFQQAEKEMFRRLGLLIRKLEKDKPNVRRERKLGILRGMRSSEHSALENQS